MSADSKTLFAQTPPVKLFFKAAVPGVISMFSMSIYGILEGIFVGQYCGEAAFAAMNLAMPFVIIGFALSDMVAVGSSIPVSIAHGQKDEARANNIFSCSIFLILAAAVLMSVFLFAMAPTLMRWMGAEGELAKQAANYLRLNALFNPFTTLVFAMDNYLRICGFIRGSMWLNIFMSFLQIVFLILAVGVLGWGLMGACLAINLGMALCVLIALLPFLLKKTLLRFVFPHYSWNLLKEVVSCGTPVFLNNIAGRLTAIVVNATLMRLGGATAVAAYSVLMYASELIWPMLYGMCDSLQPAIGFNWGAQSYERVRDISKCMFCASALISFAATIAMFFFPEPIVHLFVEKGDTALMALSVHALRLFCLGYLFRWFGFAAQTFCNAIEKPKYATILTLANTFVFPLLLLVALLPFGLDGIWLNQTSTFLLVSILAFFLLWKTQKGLAEKMRGEVSQKPGNIV